MKRSVLTVAAMLLSSFLFIAKATTYTASMSGDFSTAATWGGTGIPGTGDYVIIPAGITVTYTNNVLVNPGSIEFSNPAAMLIYGTFVLTSSRENSQVMFDNPIVITVANGGNFEDDEYSQDFYMPEPSAITVENGGIYTFNPSYTPYYTLINDQTAAPILSGINDPNDYYTLGQDGTYYNGANASIPGPFTLTVQPSSTDHHIVFSETAGPIMATTAATGIGNTTATINGTCITENNTSTIQFQYGTSPTLASYSTVGGSPGSITGSASTTPSAASGSLNGLSSGTTYYYQIVGTSSAGTSQGQILSFTTTQPPVVTSTSGNISYYLGTIPEPVFPSLSITDAASTTLSSASISISTGFNSGDNLNFVAQNGISGAYDVVTGVLTLSGSATLAQYITAIESITFNTTYPIASTRTVSLNVSAGSQTSNVVSVQINVEQEPVMVTSVSANTSSTTNANAFQYIFTFNNPVTSLIPSNFSLATTGGVTGAAIAGVVGSGTIWTVTINAGLGDGTIDLTLVNSTGISPAYTGTLPVVAPTITIDRTAPTVSISAPTATYVNSSTNFSYTVTVTDANLSTSTLADLNNILIADNSTVTGSISYPIPTIGSYSQSGNTYTIPVSFTGMNGNGTFGLVIPAGTFTDAAGNASTAATGSSVTVDNTPPSVTISAPSVSSITGGSGGTVTYTVTWSDPHLDASSINLSLSNLVVNTTGTAAGAMTITGSGNTRTISFSALSGAGNIGIDILSGSAEDLAGNQAFASGNSATFSIIAPDVITFGPLTSEIYGSSDFSPGAISDNTGSPITYTSDNSAVATIVTGNIHIVGVGIANITASQAAEGDYQSAIPVTQTLNVTQANLIVTASNASMTYGGAVPPLSVTYSGFVNGDDASSLSTLPTIFAGASPTSPTGYYPIVATNAFASNYNIVYIGGTMTVNPATLTVTPNDASMTYGGAIPALSVNYSGFVNGDDASALFVQATAATTATSASPVNSYPITASGGVAQNYNFTYDQGTLTVGQAPLVVTANDCTMVYGGSVPALFASYSGFVNGDDASSMTAQPTVSTTASSTSAVGNYATTASGAVDPNYTISYDPGNLSVTQRTLTVTANDASMTYGGSVPALSVSYSGFVNGDDISSISTQPTVSTTATSASAAGPYPITALGAAATNYTFSYDPGTLTIGQATLNITAVDASMTYGGGIPAFSVNYSGFVNGDDASSLSQAPTETTVALSSYPPGGYPINVSGAINPNYVINYTPGTLTIGPATLTITAADATMAYGGPLPAFTATYSGFVNGDDAGSLNSGVAFVSTATASSPVQGSPYTITVFGAGDPNYIINYVPGNLTITPVPLTVTANNTTSTYGAAIPALTASYSGFVNGDDASSLSTQATAATTATSASDVGAYPITASGAVDPNYTISYDPGTLTIGTAALSVTANNATSTYGSAIPALGVSYSGFVNGDNASSLATQATAATSATSGSNVGAYPINASGAVDPNYTISYDPGTLTIGQATLTITAGNASATYGSSIPTLNVSYSGFVNGDNASSITSTPALATTAISGSPVNNYPITASGAVDPNYIISYVPGTLAITPAALTVTADNASMNYGNTLPAFTVSYSGFVNGDNVSSLTTQATAVTTATSASNAGTYPINASGAVDPNYTISYDPGILTILQSLTNDITFDALPAKTYGDADFTISGTAVSGLPVTFVSQDNSIATVSQNGAGDWVVHIVSAGQVGIIANQGGNGSYSAATPVTQVLTINNASQVIAFPALPSTVSLTGGALTLSATANSGLPITYTVSAPTLATLSGNTVVFTGAGTVIITATQPGNDDYAPAAPVSDTIEVFNGGAFQSQIGVFPNPAHGTLNIHFSSDYLLTKYSMFDISGRMVKGQEAVNNNLGSIQVDISNLMPGIYLLKVICIRNHELVYPVFKVLVQ